MLYPLIPLFLSSVLLAGPRALGLIEGIAEATSSLLKRRNTPKAPARPDLNASRLDTSASLC